MPITAHPAAEWRACLASAFRTALACTIVGCATLYGPSSFQRLITFPAFSYVTVILIMTDATLGDTLRSIWLALYATMQSLGPAILSLRLIGPARLNNGTTALAVALGVLVVALPESTPLIARRISMGQVVLVYVTAFTSAAQTDVVMLPLQLAASTAVGALACVLALLLPYPRLACTEVKQSCKLLTENALERLQLYVKALCANDNTTASTSVSLAKSLTVTASNLLHNINRYQESMKWERLLFKLSRPNYMNSSTEKTEEIEVALRGMEMALVNISSFPATTPNLHVDHLKNGLLILEEHISLTLKQATNCSPHDSLTVPESNVKNIMNFLRKLQTFPENHQVLPSFFFLSCVKLLCNKTSIPEQIGPFSFRAMVSKWSLELKPKRLLSALKCSLSVGLAVLLGLLDRKPNSFWSGLIVATSFVFAREATFKMANVKAQGTVLGSVYGVLVCFVFKRFMSMRFLSLLPWFIFCGFLRRSRMYGPAGGISAVIGAILILGRKNFGAPSEFAIERIIETVIGLSCSITVDLLFRPTRASTLAQIQLSKCLGTLQECLGLLTLEGGKVNVLWEKQKQLKLDVEELRKFIEEANAELKFWYLPFHSASYEKLLASLTKFIDMFHFSARLMTLLELKHIKVGHQLKKLDSDMKSFAEFASCLMKCLQEISSVTSLTKFLTQSNNISLDLELGKLPNPNLFRAFRSNDDDDPVEKMLNLFLQRSREAVNKIELAVADDEKKEVKSQVVLSLSAFAYCIRGFMKEIREIESGIRELVQSENHTSIDVSLYEISCKIRTLQPQTHDVP